MSYTKDRDRYSRGVGAIAARDLSPGAKRRFAKRRAVVVRSMGDMPTGECSIYSNGVYYVRRQGGLVEKVSAREAARYPSCDIGASRVSTSTVTTPTGTGKLISAAAVRPKSYPGTASTSSPVVGSGGGYMGPASGSTSPGPTSGGGMGPFVGSTTPVTPVAVTPPTPPTPTPPKPAVLPPAVPSSSTIKVVSAPAVTSVVTSWLPPDKTPAPTPVVDTTTFPVPSSTSSSKSTLLWVGAGIGLLYLLTRKK